MRRPANKPIDRKAFECPQCEKSRLIRDMDYKISLEKQKFTSRNNEEIELFKDVCDFCKVKNYRKHFEPTKEDAKKILKALQEEKPVESLEDIL